ncbi:hypothetical protein V8B97DRAFT_1914689 [Scleroderma yunnanense]
MANLPYNFESPIFSAIDDQDNLVVTGGDGEQLTVIPRIPDIMPPRFRFEGVGPPHDHVYHISLSLLGGEQINTLVAEDRVIAARNGAALPFGVARYHEDQRAFIIQEGLFRPPRAWTVEEDRVFIKVHPGIIFPRNQLFRIIGPVDE